MQSKRLIDLVKDVIAEDLHSEIHDENCILIEEKHEQAKCRYVKIQLKKSGTYFGFSLDQRKGEGKNDPIYPFFNPKSPDICNKNDAILFVQKSNHVYVFLIEMKSEKRGNYLKQLKSARGFVEFILQRIQIFHQINIEKVQFRGILFLCRRERNEGTTRKKSKKEKIIFENRNGLLVAETVGNDTYWIQNFLDNID